MSWWIDCNCINNTAYNVYNCHFHSRCSISIILALKMMFGKFKLHRLLPLVLLFSNYNICLYCDFLHYYIPVVKFQFFKAFFIFYMILHKPFAGFKFLSNIKYWPHLRLNWWGGKLLNCKEFKNSTG